jgi:ABC-type multidrug transport system fused ATPase/permease subunit
MDPFWTFARRMLRYRGLVVVAVVMAALSAGSLGAGLVGITPILRNILAPPASGRSLQDMALQWNARQPPESRLPIEAILTVPDKPVLPKTLRGLARDWNQTHPPHEAIPEETVERLPDEPVAAAANLRQIAADLNRTSLVGGRIPQEWIEALPTGAFTTVVWLICGLGVLTIFGGTANFLHAFVSLTIIQRTVANIRREAFHRVLRLPLKDVVVGGTSDKVSRIVGDTAILETGFNALISKVLAQVLKGVAAFIAAMVINWKLTIAALIVAPLLYAIIRKLGKRIRRASRSALQSQAGLYGAAVEALQGLRVVKVHTTERYEAGRFHRINKDVMRQMFRVRTARALASPVVEVLSIIVLGGLSLIAVRAIQQGRLTVDSFLLTLASLAAAGASLKPLTGLLNDIQTSSGAAVRIKELLDAQPEPGHDSALPRLPRHRESIEFKNLTFTYPGGRVPALNQVNVRIAHGQRIAVVGPNGSGKTTLLALVPRLFDPDPAGNGHLPATPHPAPGAVLIDGQDIREYSIRSLRRQIGVVTQETVLFRGTIRANIAYGADDATQERIVLAAKRARAHDFIAAMPQGYDTMVGEQGLTLSGGQRQRLAIARAILREPSILILDEATSMIDADSEAKIAEALAEFSVGRTCLIVAHRLSTVIDADRIIVMDAGRIVDDGTHAELMLRCQTYRLIAENQLVKEGAEPRRHDGPK